MVFEVKRCQAEVNKLNMVRMQVRRSRNDACRNSVSKVIRRVLPKESVHCMELYERFELARD